MTITVQLPDSVGSMIFASGQEPTRAVLEAVALEAYRAARVTESEVRQMLGFDTRMEVHQFLKEHGAFMHYTSEDLERDRVDALQLARQSQDRAGRGDEPRAK